MKKYLLSTVLSISIISNIYSEPQGMPSVADVFGGMSEEEITRQVQMGQQFLEDLEKYGTPEEKAEFEKILLETLNSMSEEDFQDLQNIAKMVEPNLPAPEAKVAQPSVVQPKKEEAPALVVTESDTEKFKNLIASIIARIDEIVQKIESCKECQEELHNNWANRVTFNNLKRQIAQLKNNNLAQRLSKKDLSEDDKKLVDTLETFLQDLTNKNSKLVIEDSFGLSDNKELEQKYLKQTKEITALFDNYIDLLAPKVEKFLSKWDPEALQLAKEASQKTEKALGQAQESLKRVPSADARPVTQERGYNSQRSRDYGPSYSDYDHYNQYGYPQDYYNYPQGSEYAAPQDSKSISGSGTVGTKSGASAAPKDKSEIDKKVKPASAEQKPESVNFNDIMDSIDTHFDRYTQSHVNKNIDFLNNTIAQGYKNLTPALEKDVKTWGNNADGGVSKGAKPNIEGINDWTFDSFIPYTQSISKALQNEYKDFAYELDSGKKLVNKIENNAKDLSLEELNKISKKLDSLQDRFNSYHDTYQNVINSIEDNFSRNFYLITDRVIVGDEKETSYEKPMKIKDVHNEFVAKLKNEIGDKIDQVISDIANIKAHLERKSKRKSKSKSSSLIMNAER